MDEYSWSFIELLPDGHRLFGGQFVDEHEGARFAIADESGREPQDTTDGILWLDFERDLEIDHGRAGESFFIPLKDDAGEQTKTVTDASTLLQLAAGFEWPITDQANTTYHIEKVG